MLKDRKYVRLDKRRLYPEDRGRIVVAFLESFFAKYVEYDFTAGLEEQLDLISNNEIAWREVLRDFWRDFIGAVDETKDLKISAGDRRARRAAGAASVPAARRRHRSAAMPDLRQRPAHAEALASSAPSSAARIIRNAAIPARCRRRATARPRSAPRSSARIPETGLEVTLRSGRFGPYVQLGEAVRRRKAQARQPAEGHGARRCRPRASRSQLLSLPREVGRHPEDGEPIRAGIGRFGPYVQHGKTYANLEAGDDVFNIGLNRAVTLIAEKARQGPALPPLRRRSGPPAWRPSDQGRADRRQERPLRSLCQPRRRQRHAAERQDAGDRHARGGGRAASTPAPSAEPGAARAAARGQARRDRRRTRGTAKRPAKRPAAKAAKRRGRAENRTRKPTQAAE